MTQKEIDFQCKAINNIIRGAQQEIEQAKVAIKKLQRLCNHHDNHYHYRACAEDDCYYTCLICGYQWT